jgi:WD40 repeat protein
VAFGDDDQLLAVAGTGTVELWDLSSAAVEQWDTSPIVDPNQYQYDESGNPVPPPGGPVPLATVAPEGRQVSSTDLSSDGRRLAVGGDSGQVAIWDLSDPRAPTLAADRRDAHGAAPVDAAFSPDGRLLATTSDDRLLKVWDADHLDGDPIGTVDLADTPHDLAFSPTGRLVAVVGASRVAHLVDTSNPQAPREVGTTTPQPRLLDAVAFSPDGNRLLVGGGNDIRYWDVTTPDAPERLADPTVPGPYYGFTLYDLTFLADGEHAILGVNYTTAPVLDLDAEAKADQLCAQAGDGITEEEWNTYLPEFDYTPPCG